MCYCYNTFVYHFISDGLNKGIIKISQISVGKESKDHAFLIPLYSKKAIDFYEETVVQILEKVESKKKSYFKSEKDNNFERQNNDEANKKYFYLFKL